MRRRDFIKVVAGSAITWPPTARAQQSAKTHRVALVHPSASTADMSESGGNPNYAALFKELRRLGYIEGVNLVITRYSGGGQEKRFPELCQEVVRMKPDVIVTASTRLVLSFKAATDTIPIVGAMGDPVPVGIVANIARPEGNITGVSSMAGPKSGASDCRSCARLSRRHRRWGSSVRVSYGACRQQMCCGKMPSYLGISLLGPPMESPIKGEEYRRVLEAMAQEHVDAVIIGDQTENITYRQLIVDLVRAAKPPAIFPFREYFESGAHDLRPFDCRYLPQTCGLHRPDSKGCAPRRFADLLTIEVRLAGESNDRKSSRTYYSTLVTCARRRGDRMRRREFTGLLPAN
jgi:putative ABC transport system substrate-binding protein